MTAPPLLDVHDLVKSYGDARVIDGVSFSIAPGECLGVIGPNGAGKTTTIRMCLWLTAPDSGQIRYFARADGAALEMPRDALAIKARLGVVTQFDSLDPDFSCAENLFVFGRYFGLRRAQMAERVPQLLDFAALGHKANAKPAELSGGMKQRVGIARAFAIEPKMLLLDEPFGALDALTRGTIQDELLKIVQATGQTVFMITHDVDEAILLADKVVLMSNGPLAKIAEIVEITMPRSRTRAEMHHDPQFYRIRNHLVDFLVNRSKSYAGSDAAVLHDPRRPPVVRPGLATDEPPPSDNARPILKQVVNQ